MKKKKIKLETLFSVLLVALAMLHTIPFLMTVLGSFKFQAEAAKFDLSLPSKWPLSNYAHAMKSGKILPEYISSAIITISVTFVFPVLGALAEIMVSRRNDKICEGLYYYFIFGPTLTLQIASVFFSLKAFHIYGILFSVICVSILLRTPFTMVTFSSFVKGVPREVDGTAMIDRCSFGRMVFYVLPPALKPTAVINTTVTATDVWNSFMISLFYLGPAKKATVAMTIYSFFDRYSRDWQYAFEALPLVVLPMPVLFVILQKYIVARMTSGAVRGRWMNRMKARSVVIGYGWRAGFFYRPTRMLPGQFEITTGVFRTRERVAQTVEEHSVFATDDLEETLETKPDLVVPRVPRGIVKDYLIRLMKAGYPVLCETPPAKNVREMEGLWETKVTYNGKVQVVEQHLLQPYYIGLLQIVNQGYLGKISGVMLSALHGYYAISISRKFLGVGFENCRIRKQRSTADVTATNSRNRPGYDGKVTQTDRDWVSMALRQGETVFLDSSGEQYSSPIRTRRLSVQGVHGEISDIIIRYLNRENVVATQEVQRNDIGMHDNMEWSRKGIMFLDREIYTNPYYPIRLGGDEVAVTSYLTNMKEFMKTGKEFYPLKGTLQDTYPSFAMEEAIEKKQMMEANRQIRTDQDGAVGFS